MKQKKWMWRAAVAVVLLAVFINCLTPPSIQKKISRALALDVSAGTVLAQSESHGGFHGDGMTYVALSFENDRVQSKIAENGGWKALPLSENLARLVRGLPTEELDSKSRILGVRNGYYCFLDRQADRTDRHDDTDVLNRYSFNFTIAVYDADADILYYVVLDT